MKLLWKVICFIVANVVIGTFIILLLSSLTRAGVMGGFGTFWKGLEGVVDSIVRAILNIAQVPHQLG